jgi:hypothetical protein
MSRRDLRSGPSWNRTCRRSTTRPTPTDHAPTASAVGAFCTPRFCHCGPIRWLHDSSHVNRPSSRGSCRHKDGRAGAGSLGQRVLELDRQDGQVWLRLGKGVREAGWRAPCRLADLSRRHTCETRRRSPLLQQAVREPMAHGACNRRGERKACGQSGSQDGLGRHALQARSRLCRSRGQTAERRRLRPAGLSGLRADSNREAPSEAPCDRVVAQSELGPNNLDKMPYLGPLLLEQALRFARVSARCKSRTSRGTCSSADARRSGTTASSTPARCAP